MPSRKPLPDPAAGALDPVRAALTRFLRDHPGLHTLRIAFSGGRDSTVLLHAAADLGLPGLEAMHVDHALRADSEAQAAHCRQVAAALGVPFRSCRLPPLEVAADGVEAAARAARYQRLREGLDGDGVILTAQHADDQAETFLLAALRGSGPEGLKAMAPLRREGQTWLGRPLLAVSAAEVAEAAEAMGLAWYDDPSNTDTRYDRNFLRHEVMPLLRGRFAVPHGLCRAAGWQRETAEHLERYFGARLEAVQADDPRTLSRRRLLQLADPERRGVLRLWLRRLGRRPPGRERLEEFLRQLTAAGEAATPRLEWPEGVVRVYRDRIDAGGSAPPQPPASQPWPVDQDQLRLATGARLSRSRLPGLGIAADTELEVVYRRGGEVVRTAAGRRPLKKLMQERGIPPWQRDRIPLLRRPGGEILAVLWDAAPDPDGAGSGGLRAGGMPPADGGES